MVKGTVRPLTMRCKRCEGVRTITEYLPSKGIDQRLRAYWCDRCNDNIFALTRISTPESEALPE